MLKSVELQLGRSIYGRVERKDRERDLPPNCWRTTVDYAVKPQLQADRNDPRSNDFDSTTDGSNIGSELDQHESL